MWLFLIKYIASTYKETLLLIRDRAGLSMLFIMPTALVLIMTMLQDSTFKVLEEKKLSVLVLNQDADTFGINIVDGLKQSKFFHVIDSLKGKVLAESALREQVAAGNFQIGIMIRPNASQTIRENIKYRMLQQLPEEQSGIFGSDPVSPSQPASIDVFFDPVTKNSFKQAIISALQEYSSMVEAKVLFGVYSRVFEDMLDIKLKKQGVFSRLVNINEQYAATDQHVAIPNSVQHNVPAWAVFAMFFVVIPLAGNLIKERESGVSLRLRTMPGSDLAIIMGKVTAYFMVIILQALLMLVIGIYLLPLLGLPQLDPGHHYLALFVLTATIALAATGYGILVGTMAGTLEQSSIFGSISVVILAAIGGVWVPVFMMSDVMQVVTKLSPLNWSLNGYYDIFLRNAGLMDILPNLTALFLFFVTCVSVSWWVNTHKNQPV
ncbi:MAG: hypothetical protein CVT99_04410 [Bacteroidetes bacterium HGW-Bacteroidetes-16]|jgi:ABC-2 type transport system permease protein|nr:MAG: hypothetical protein CVT99_04410 [Bacteroidetes bacterium HGW-Bacteroidetes-16]